MTTLYHVYLPPAKLDPLSDFRPGTVGDSTHHPSLPISFRTINGPASLESLQSFSQSYSQRSPNSRWSRWSLFQAPQSLLAPPAEIAEEEANSKSGGVSDRKGKRKAATQDHSQQSPDSSTSRRQSGRLRAKSSIRLVAEAADSARDTSIVPEPDAGVNAGPSHPASTSRRSDRLARPSNSLILPIGFNTTDDSLLSLNTTLSPSSQLLIGTHPSDTTGQGDTSVANLPRWYIPLSKLSTLQSLLAARSGKKAYRPDDRQIVTVSVMVCVTRVETAVLRRRKEERDRGMDGTLWVGKWDVVAPPIGDGGQAAEVGCEVKLWEECARDWSDERVRRGDVILLQNVEFKPATRKDAPQLVLSPRQSHTPTPIILYRTLPRYTGTTPGGGGGSESNYIYRPAPMAPHTAATGRVRRIISEDRVLRPDLRLGRSDPGVRRVAEIARWFAEWVGGEPP